jgi:hypothetical protein
MASVLSIPGWGSAMRCQAVGQALSPGVLSMICNQGVKVPHGP